MTLPYVSFVAIGLDEAQHLPACLEAIAAQDLAGRAVEILYVDSGSSDGSPEIASRRGADRIVAIPREGASAARARNAGLAEARGSFVHFVDGDTVLEAGWARAALDALEADPELAGVEGVLAEVRTESSLLHAVCALDWPREAGPVAFVGGNALYRTQPLRDAGGFDTALPVGEEPELGARLRARGLRFERLARPMARHDLDLRGARDYWRRAYRNGLSCGLVVGATGGLRRGYWRGRLLRMWLQAAWVFGTPLLALVLLAIQPDWLPPLALAYAAVLFVQLARKARGVEAAGERRGLAWAYALHAYASRLPAALGAAAGWWKAPPAKAHARSPLPPSSAPPPSARPSSGG